MDGKIKKLIDSEGVDAFPVTIADAVFVDESTSLAEKLKAISAGSSSTYVIDIKRFGITKGIPSKPYKNTDYEKAYANVLGINRAIKYASINGFTAVVLPKESYAICYPQTIFMASNMTLNLNGSTLKVIYDSDNKSPYDTRTGTDYYNFAGVSFTFSRVNHAHIINGKIVGDVYDRSFVNPNEKAVEGSYGVSFTDGSSYCSVSHCDISGYMGDNINLTSQGIIRSAPTGAVLGDIDSKGVVIEATTTVVTNLITIPVSPDGLSFNVFSMAGQGYSRQTSLNKKEFDVFYYGADNTYIGVLKNMRVHFPIPIPPAAAKYRLKFYNESEPTKNFNILIDYGGVPSHNVIEYNEIYNGHRGGITMGGSYCVVRNNRIRNNGKFSNVFLDGIPAFNDTTRYAINQEDSYGDNSIIKNNLITGGFHGILTRGYSVFIEGNVITNMDVYGIVVYDQQYTSLRANYIRRAGIFLFGASGHQNAAVNITGNYIQGSFNISNPTYDVICEGNHFVDTVGSLGDAKYENNIVRLVNVTGASIPTGTRIKNNLFYANPKDVVKPDIVINTAGPLKNNEFYGLMIKFNRTDTIALNLNECTFTNCDITNQYNYNSIILKNCNLKDTVLKPVNINGSSNNNFYTLTNCNIESTQLINFFYLLSNVTNGGSVMTLENCNFLINNSDFKAIFDNKYPTNSISAIVKNNYIEYKGATTLIASYYNSSIEVNSSIIANNIIKNISFSPLMGGKYINYDPEVSNIIEPNSGYFNVGNMIMNAAPAPEKGIGWICVKAGIANDMMWSPSTSYTTGTKIYSGTKIYEAQNTGISASDSPEFSFNFNATIMDTKGIPAWSPKGVKVGDKVMPNTPNGFYYECITAGNTSDKEPMWVATVNPISDGTVVWKPMKVIVWKNIGDKAVFNLYGIIN
ncbi:right-handed parallel beta-helix repeat-containing protein [Priestia aryabhattai]|uniref:right-handed parallel beta-helix repeat-containing protein n=1 Tax=Priestia aryabhattai TaxID=412384 RepID=UPI00265B19E4|nr:right-handed parallel beta-helix repeat-containing protein [Priestia aryabhattai]WKG28855.1 right-handed parallel beta-helix repeat-containing protein [Priestia aryabhattai]